MLPRESCSRQTRVRSNRPPRRKLELNQYRLEAIPAVEIDIEAALDWYEREEAGLGFQFLDELRAAYVRILDHPFGYQDLVQEFVAR